MQTGVRLALSSHPLAQKHARPRFANCVRAYMTITTTKQAFCATRAHMHAAPSPPSTAAIAAAAVAAAAATARLSDKIRVAHDNRRRASASRSDDLRRLAARAGRVSRCERPFVAATPLPPGRGRGKWSACRRLDVAAATMTGGDGGGSDGGRVSASRAKAKRDGGAQRAKGACARAREHEMRTPLLQHRSGEWRRHGSDDGEAIEAQVVAREAWRRRRRRQRRQL